MQKQNKTVKMVYYGKDTVIVVWYTTYTHTHTITRAYTRIIIYYLYI